MLTIIENNLQTSQTDKMNQAVNFLIDNAEYIISQIDASDKTIKKYQTDVKLFIEFINQSGISIDTFRQYKKHLKELQSISVKTKNGKLVAAKVLLKEVIAKGFFPTDITSNVKGFKISQEHVKDGLNAEEVKRCKDVIDSIHNTEKRTKLQAMFYLFAFQGLRQFELAALTIEDLKLSDDFILVTGKGRDDKERIDLHPKTKEALQNYLTSTGKKSGFIFTSESNNSKAKAEGISTRALRMIFSDIFKAANIENRSLHGFRHYFVTTFLEAVNGDILTTQRFSRHKSITAVKMYDDRKKKKELLPMFYKAFAV
jgi:integrase/recombinase XerC